MSILGNLCTTHSEELSLISTNQRPELVSISGIYSTLQSFVLLIESVRVGCKPFIVAVNIREDDSSWEGQAEPRVIHTHPCTHVLFLYTHGWARKVK
jgi:hypothetical protein